jgi:hypothetical protein
MDPRRKGSATKNAKRTSFACEINALLQLPQILPHILDSHKVYYGKYMDRQFGGLEDQCAPRNSDATCQPRRAAR